MEQTPPLTMVSTQISHHRMHMLRLEVAEMQAQMKCAASLEVGRSEVAEMRK